MRYAVVIEKAETNYSAYVPDLPGCVATGATLEQAEAEIRERGPPLFLSAVAIADATSRHDLGHWLGAAPSPLHSTTSRLPDVGVNAFYVNARSVA